MWPFNRRRAQLKAAQPASITGMVGLPYPVYPETTYENLVTYGFKLNELVYRAVTLIGQALASAPLRVYSEADDQELPAHPLRQLVTKPNSWMSEFELWQDSAISRMLAGNWYCFKRRPMVGGLPLQLIPLRPDRVAIVGAEDGIAAYLYTNPVGTQMVIDPQDMIHIRLPNPTDPFMGTPPMQAAIRRTAIDNELADFVKAMTQNSAVPGTVITMAPGSFTGVAVDPDIVKRLKEQWKRSYGGSKRGEPAFLEAGMTVNTVALNFQEMEFGNLTNVTESRILMALGVPPILVGAKVGLDRSTFANYEEAVRAFYLYTVEPLQNVTDDVIGKDLLAEFDKGRPGRNICRFDTSRVAAYAELRQREWQNANTGLMAGWVTLNEARAAVGKPPVQGGDVFLRNMTILPEEAVLERSPARKALPQIKSGRKRARQAAALARRDALMKMGSRFSSLAKDEFRTFGEAVLNVVPKAGEPGEAKQQAGMFGDLDEIQREGVIRVREKFAGVFETAWLKAAELGAGEIGISFDLDNSDILKRLETYRFKFAEKISESLANDVRAVMLQSQTESWNYEQLIEALKSKFSEWSSVRAGVIAVNESTRAANRGAVEAWRQGGIRRKEWLTSDSPCDYCAALQGTIVGIDEVYLSEGTDFQPPGTDRPLTIDYQDVEGGNAHVNCVCVVMPVEEYQ